MEYWDLKKVGRGRINLYLASCIEKETKSF